ncbi:MAG TPA: hypothetical protein VIE43_22230 [Thermoanaerobaculia bacterium]|jgi:hypothetical protein|nr:hypothetical protein [Thermoanaerobaculia bacterium]
MRIALFLASLLFVTPAARAATYTVETCAAADLKTHLESLGTRRLVAVLPAITRNETWCPPPPVDVGCHATPAGPVVCIDPGPPQPCIQFQVLDTLTIVSSDD